MGRRVFLLAFHGGEMQEMTYFAAEAALVDVSDLFRFDTVASEVRSWFGTNREEDLRV